MKIKKNISVLTVAFLLSTSIFSNVVLADDLSQEKIRLMEAAGELPKTSIDAGSQAKISRENAIKIASSILDNENQYKLNNINFSSNNYLGVGSWNLNYTDKQSPNSNYSLSIDADSGEILSYYYGEGYLFQQSFVAKYTKDEAKLKADEFIKNVLKENLNNYELQTDNINYYSNTGIRQPVRYSLNYIYKVNGVPFSNKSLNVGVDGTSGKIVNFNKGVPSSSYDESKLPSPQGVVSSDDVLKEYRKNSFLTLKYITTHRVESYYTSTPEVKLAYSIESLSPLYDALSGKPYDYSGIPTTDYKSFYDLKANPAQLDKNAKLNNAPITEEQANIKAEQIREKIEQHLNIKFDSNQNRVSNSYSYMGDASKIWNYSWNTFEGSNRIFFNININSETGNVINISFSQYDEKNDTSSNIVEVNEKYNWDQSKEIAIDILKELIPEQYGFYVDENIGYPYNEDFKKYSKQYSYSFTRLVNNIRFNNNSAFINVDRETGKLTNFHFNWSDVEFPSKDVKVSLTDATDIYFKDISPSLMYNISYPYYYAPKQKVEMTPKLLYTFSTKGTLYAPGYMIDAITGEILDYSGNIVENKTTSTEINSPAKRAAHLLAMQGIVNNNIDLKANINKYEMVKILASVRGINIYNGIPPTYTKSSYKDISLSNKYLSYIENAVSQKILTEPFTDFKGDEFITKAEYAKLLINLIGYSDIAQFKDIFKVNNSTNIPDDMLGYVALCKALELLPTSQFGTFDGNEKVTYEEFVTTLYKALNFVK